MSESRFCRPSWAGSALLAVLTASTALIGILGSPLRAGAQSILNLSQISMNLDDGSHPNTDWGSVDLSFTGASSPQYFNFSINGSWQVQNVPLPSIEGTGNPHTYTFDYKIGTNGVPVSSANYGFSLTNTPSVQPTETFLGQAVGARQVTGFTGEGGFPITYTPVSALLGGLANRIAGVSNYPNQEAGVNECVPVSVSNSLQYLNQKFNLNMQASDITIGKMKTATGWTAGGTPVVWPANKAAYMQANGLPILTTVSTTMTDAFRALQSGFDVEIGGGGHRASLVGMVDLGSGRNIILVAHDTQQGAVGGTKIEVGSYDTATNRISNITWLNNQTLRNVVIESPTPEPSAVALFGAGTLALFGFSRRRKLVKV